MEEVTKEKETMTEMQALSQEYSQLCMKLGDTITRIDLMLEEKTRIKDSIAVVNKKATAIKVPTPAAMATEVSTEAKVEELKA